MAVAGASCFGLIAVAYGEDKTTKDTQCLFGNAVPESMKDDATGETLMQRPDDTASALTKRLQGYHGETVPILEHYKPHNLVGTVNANQTMDGVWGDVLAVLKRAGK